MNDGSKKELEVREALSLEWITIAYRWKNATRRKTVSLKIKGKKDNWCEVVTTVYGPNDSCLCSQIWTELKQIHRRWSKP